MFAGEFCLISKHILNDERFLINWKQEVQRYLENYNHANIQAFTSNEQTLNSSSCSSQCSNGSDFDANHSDWLNPIFTNFRNEITSHVENLLKKENDQLREELKKVSGENGIKEQRIQCLVNDLKLVTAERNICRSKLEIFQRQKNVWQEKMNEFLEQGKHLRNSFSDE